MIIVTLGVKTYVINAIVVYNSVLGFYFILK